MAWITIRVPAEERDRWQRAARRFHDANTGALIRRVLYAYLDGFAQDFRRDDEPYDFRRNIDYGPSSSDPQDR